jgi:hypothetical protein
VKWLREKIFGKFASNVIVVGEIADFLINENRADLLPQAGTLRGDGLEAFDDRFTFASYAFQGKMIYPLVAIVPLYCQYLCPYDAIHSVYEDEGGKPVVVLKDALLGN